MTLQKSKFWHNVKHIACQFILRKQLLLLTHKQLSSKQLSMYVWKKVTAASQTIFSMRFVLQTWPWLQWPLLTATSLFAHVCVHYSQVNTFDWKQIKKQVTLQKSKFWHNVKHIACQFILRKQLLLLTHKQLSSKQLSMYVWKKVTAASQTIFSMRFVL